MANDTWDDLYDFDGAEDQGDGDLTGAGAGIEKYEDDEQFPDGAEDQYNFREHDNYIDEGLIYGEEGDVQPHLNAPLSTGSGAFPQRRGARGGSSTTWARACIAASKKYRGGAVPPAPPSSQAMWTRIRSA
eukprot:10609223-Heterocapsa_arctica.AAC.1